MRIIFGMAMVAASVSLSGCVSNTFDSLSNLSNGCTTGTTSVTCTNPTSGGGSGGGSGSGSGGTPTTPSNGGNNATLTQGDTTIALESSSNITPVGTPAISKLGTNPLSLSNTSTANQQIWFNTNTASNSQWPLSKTMVYDDYGTCINDGGVNTASAGACNNGTGGHGLGGNYKQYRAYSQGKYDEELQVWSWNQSYATQYRDVTASGTDPQHQAWSFGGNYTAAASMPTSGSVNYSGQWTGTAKTANFGDTAPSTDPSTVNITIPAGAAKNMSYNNNWMVTGTSSVTANFGAGTMTGTLTPTTWTGVDNNNAHRTVDVASAKANAAACYAMTGVCDVSTAAGAAQFNNWQNYNGGFMDTNVNLAGTITTDPKSTTKPNQVSGTATLDNSKGWITASGNNPMQAGFFGTRGDGNPQEVTGAFALNGTLTAPNGGNKGINADQRATMEMSGIFNAQ